jgi:MFS family permease
MNLTFAGISFLLVLWLEKVQGYGPTQAGLLLLPATLGIFAFIPVGGRLSLRTGSKLPVVTGLVIMSTGVFLLAFLGRDRSTWVVGVALVVLGLGLGLLSTPISDTAVGGVPIDLAGTAAGVFKMSSMVGGAIGVALLTALATVFSSDQAVRAATAAGATPEQIDEASSALVGSSNYEQALSGLTDAQRAEVLDTAKSVFSEGVADSFVATGLIALGATALVFLLWPKGLRRRTAPGPG